TGAPSPLDPFPLSRRTFDIHRPRIRIRPVHLRRFQIPHGQPLPKQLTHRARDLCAVLHYRDIARHQHADALPNGAVAVARRETVGDELVFREGVFAGVGDGGVEAVGGDEGGGGLEEGGGVAGGGEVEGAVGGDGFRDGGAGAGEDGTSGERGGEVGEEVEEEKDEEGEHCWKWLSSRVLFLRERRVDGLLVFVFVLVQELGAVLTRN
ncbi:hypothetical protein MMC06_004201, partial [Schaereria dolodes]|nr:hypothetical protein [Schaereria dolodes]